MNFEIKIHGVAAHAAKAYEKGKNAILITADLLKKLPIGRNLKEGWTMNIGVVEGGDGTNVVCDSVELKGELRAFNKVKINKLVLLLKAVCQRLEEKHKTKIEINFDKSSYVPPFVGRESGQINKICIEASKKIGLKYIFKESYSTSDANSFSGRGLEVISVSRGGKNSHSKKEGIRLSELKTTVNLLKEIIYLS